MVTSHERDNFASNAFLGIISISRNLNTVYFIVRLHVSKESVGGGVCDGVGGCDGTGGEGV